LVEFKNCGRRQQIFPAVDHFLVELEHSHGIFSLWLQIVGLSNVGERTHGRKNLLGPFGQRSVEAVASTPTWFTAGIAEPGVAAGTPVG
jgi:hypothetical protein